MKVAEKRIEVLGETDVKYGGVLVTSWPKPGASCSAYNSSSQVPLDSGAFNKVTSRPEWLHIGCWNHQFATPELSKRS